MGVRQLSVAAVLNGVVLSGSASVGAAPPAPAFPPEPSTGLVLRIAERGPDLPWTLTIKNESATPMRVGTDARLLWLEVKSPAEKKPLRCRLPERDLPKLPVPSLDVRLGAGESLSYQFDPRLFCFEGGRGKALVPGSFVVPHFGWERRTTTRFRGGKAVKEPVRGPEIASPLTDSGKPAPDFDGTGTSGHAELIGAGLGLGSSYIVWASSALAKPDEAQEPVALTAVRGSDALVERDVTVTVRVANRGRRRQRLYVRREHLSYEVSGPGGRFSCVDDEGALSAPDVHAFTTLPAGGSVTLTTRLVELCPRGSFALPGLYLVHARLDATDDGSAAGVRAFTGRVLADTPALVRVRRSEVTQFARVQLTRAPDAH